MGGIVINRQEFTTLVRTLPRNVLRKKEKRGLCDRSREHMGHVPNGEK
jgi:hypothetical protein